MLLDLAPAPASTCPPLTLEGTALFLDLDGTLAPIMPRPEDVGPDAALTALLSQLQTALNGRLAVVSGRTIADVDRILDGAVQAVAGVHGLERRTRSGVWRAAPSPNLPAALAELDGWIAGRDGLDIENKTLGLTLHYRAAPALEAEARVFARELAARHALALQLGDMVAELKTPGADKAAAVRALMTEPPFAGATPVFVGDDLTDEHGFRAAAELGGHGVLVGGRTDTVARERLPSVPAVHQWLRAALA